MTVFGLMCLRDRRAVATLLVATLLTLFASQLPLPDARARFGGAALTAEDFAAFQPIAGYLSTSSWLMVTGQDPRLLSASGGGERPVPNPSTDWLSVPPRSPSPLFSRNLLVSHAIGQIGLTSDPQIAVDPLDPEHLVLAVVDYNLTSIATYVTLDGGETWEGPRQIRRFAQDLLAGGPPDVAFDRAGNVYITSISLGVTDARLGSSVSTVVSPKVVISKSEDGGITWSDASAIASSSVETTSFVDERGNDQTGVTVEFLDSPSLAIGPDPDAPDRDFMYVVYTDLKVHYSTVEPGDSPFVSNAGSETTIRLVRSTDGGQRWSDPIGVSPTFMQTRLSPADQGEPEAAGPTSGRPEISAAEPSLQGNQSGPTSAITESLTEDVVQGAQAAVLTDGTLAVAFFDTTLDGAHQGLAMVIVAVSADGGRSLEPVQAGIFREINEVPRNANFRYWGSSFPRLAVGPGSEMYIAVTTRSGDRPTDDGDNLLFRSTDQGRTWESPVRLDSDSSDHLQFFPAIAVSSDGTVHAMWGDMRNDPQEVRYEISYSESIDQGETWQVLDTAQGIDLPSVAVTDFASNSLNGFAGGRFLGDHFALDASTSDVYLAWVDTRLGNIQPPDQQIGFARRQGMPLPSLRIDPATSMTGSDVVVRGSGFQPRSGIAVRVGSISVASLSSDEDGTFATTVTLPVTTAGKREISAVDATGNRAGAELNIAVGIDTIAERLGISATSDVASPAPEGTPVASPTGAP